MLYFIYSIVCKNVNSHFVYVGSTNNFNSRRKSHTSNCSNETGKSYHYKVYDTIRKKGGMENFRFNIVEIIYCKTRVEANDREKFHCIDMKVNMNSQDPQSCKTVKYGLDREKYCRQTMANRADKMDDYKTYQAKYYQKKKEKRLESHI